MPKSISFLILAMIFGTALTLFSIYTNLPTGWIGGIFIIGWTLVTRRRWLKLQKTTGLEPGGPERSLRLYAVGTALLFGHSITAYAFPNIDLHVGSGNSLAIDSWTMIAAFILSTFIIRKDSKIRDERDAAIKAQGSKAGYVSLITILITFSFALGFLPPSVVENYSYFTIANFQITIVLASLLIKYAGELLAYAQDTKASFVLETG